MAFTVQSLGSHGTRGEGQPVVYLENTFNDNDKTLVIGTLDGAQVVRLDTLGVEYFTTGGGTRFLRVQVLNTSSDVVFQMTQRVSTLNANLSFQFWGEPTQGLLNGQASSGDYTHHIFPPNLYVPRGCSLRVFDAADINDADSMVLHIYGRRF